VLLIGNLTKDPELRYTPSGTPVANLRLAINSSFKDQAGQRKEETCFITIVVWSRQAEVCNQYLKKGRSVFVEGRLISRSWEVEGKTRSVMEVRADRVQFLGAPGGAGAETSRAGAEAEAQPESAPVGGGGDTEELPEGGADADVPF
jgi:single-strand DNA-binding protein